MTTTTLKRPQWMASDALAAVGSGLARKLTALGEPAKPDVLARALHELLDGQDQAARELRTAIQVHLALVSNGRVDSDTAVNGENEDLLSTEAAAQLMNCSRPYVAMLIDAEKLAGGVKSKGGHRKVPRSSVLQWIDAAESVGDKSYRKAASDAGMYSIPDEIYVKDAKRNRRGA